MTKPLSIPQLRQFCQTEQEKFRQAGQSNEIYCFELFRRALIMRDEAAWDAIYAQYCPLVIHWVQRHGRFSETGEDAQSFVNDAFLRMWKHIKEDRDNHFTTLGQYLAYLKQCVWSTISDYLRHREKDALLTSFGLESFDNPSPAVDAEAEFNLLTSQLKQILKEATQETREWQVAEASWIYGLAPREIYTRYQPVFSSPAAVNDCKRTLLKRLRRNKKLKDFLSTWPKNS